jgi:hypothetical protein
MHTNDGKDDCHNSDAGERIIVAVARVPAAAVALAAAARIANVAAEASVTGGT